MSLPTREVWIEMLREEEAYWTAVSSLPTREVWIEISVTGKGKGTGGLVTSYAGSVD